MGYSRAHFSRSFKEVFGQSPKYYLKKFRYRILEEEVSRDPYAIGYKIAVNCGFYNEQSLQKYLKYNFGLTLNHFRERYIHDRDDADKQRIKRKRNEDGDEGMEVPIE
jgi:transcriptional regulator GlxA family with amidase domain